MMTALRLLICLLAVVIGSAATAAPAFAHAALIRSDPADGATLDTAPTAITLTFNQDIEQQFATVTISGPDGSAYAAGDVRVDGPTAAINVKPLTAAPYVIAYRVISADGHPISGQYTFELTKAAPAAPGTTMSVAAPTSAAPAAAPAADAGGGFPMWIAVAVAAVIAGLAIVMVRRRG